MLTEYSASHPIRAGAIAWPDGRTTVVAKLTFSFPSTGAWVLAEEQDPLTLDVTDPRGELVYPSDFAPYKQSCDVSVVGDAALDRAHPGRLSAGGMVKTAESRETLGPRETFCPLGDPTDPSVVDLWATGQIDFARFHVAPPDRRMAWPAQGFAIEYLRGPVFLSGRFEGPFARACVLTVDAAHILSGIPLLLDTVLVDPVRRRAWLHFRGVYSPGSGADAVRPGRCVFNLSPNPVFDPRVMSAWRTAPFATPKTARHLERHAPGRSPSVDGMRALNRSAEVASHDFKAATPGSRPAVPTAKLDDARLAELELDLWQGEHTMAQTLARYGLTDDDWREFQRARMPR